MDDTRYENNRQVYQIARSTAVLTGAITAFIAFCAFSLAGFEIQETVAWMFALSLMAASALFVFMYIVTTNQLKNRQRTA